MKKGVGDSFYGEVSGERGHLGRIGGRRCGRDVRAPLVVAVVQLADEIEARGEAVAEFLAPWDVSGCGEGIWKSGARCSGDGLEPEAPGTDAMERDAPATGGEQEQWLVGFLVRGAIAVAGGRVHLEGVKPFDGVVQVHRTSVDAAAGSGNRKMGRSDRCSVEEAGQAQFIGFLLRPAGLLRTGRRSSFFAGSDEGPEDTPLQPNP